MPATCKDVPALLAAMERGETDVELEPQTVSYWFARKIEEALKRSGCKVERLVLRKCKAPPSIFAKALAGGGGRAHRCGSLTLARAASRMRARRRWREGCPPARASSR